MELGLTDVKVSGNNFLIILMSVYSGFSTRKLEKVYGNLTCSLISLLSYKVMSAYKDWKVNEKNWIIKFMQVHSQLAKLESNKHLPPKISVLCDDLVYHFNSKFSFPTLEASRQPSLAPFKLPEVTKKRDFSLDVSPSRYFERHKMQRGSLAPPPKQLKSDYYEKALEKYFDLTQRYEKVNEEMIQNISNESLTYQISNNSAF